MTLLNNSTNLPSATRLDSIYLQVYNILDEFILSGEVEESSKRDILERIRELEKLD